MLTKLIVVPSTFLGAYVLAVLAAGSGFFTNSVVLTLDSGFKVTWAYVIAGFVALLAFGMKSK